MEWHIACGEDMESLGTHCARACVQPLVVYLHGELGAGKTTFVRGYLRALGWQGKVKSPTYALVEPYQLAAHTVYHFDLYRVADPAELEYVGIRDFFAADAALLVEWPECGQGVLPSPDWDVSIEYAGTGRRVTLNARSARGQEALQRVLDSGPHVSG